MQLLSMQKQTDKSRQVTVVQGILLLVCVCKHLIPQNSLTLFLNNLVAHWNNLIYSVSQKNPP